MWLPHQQSLVIAATSFAHCFMGGQPYFHLGKEGESLYSPSSVDNLVHKSYILAKLARIAREFSKLPII